MKVLIVDDLLATGGTLSGACKLVSSCGGVVVEMMCVVEIAFLHGREKLPKEIPFFSLISE